jgi:ribosomal protein S18 acetylase RimI-like enzyme
MLAGVRKPAQGVSVEIKTMLARDIDRVTALLVAAFQERPFYRYIAPDSDIRRAFLSASFRLRMEESLGACIVDIAEDAGKLTGVAVWVPPSRDLSAAPVRLPDAAMKAMMSAFPPDMRARFYNFLRTLAGAREKAVRPPFWSLAPIAVLPSEQGRGIASALIRRNLRDADAQRLPCFLATQDEANLAIYRRFGFEKVREDSLPLTDIVHYTMLRPAQ